MICTDSSFLIDYLTETEDGPAAAFLDAHDEPFCAPAIALFDVYCGPADDSASVPIAEIAGLLDWLDPVSFTEESAREAARIRRELRASERSLGTADILVAADARRIGATLVTADADFEAVDGLSVATFR